MKATLASRRDRIARIQAKQPAESVVVTVDTRSSDAPELLRQFGRWLDRVLIEASNPDDAA